MKRYLLFVYSQYYPTGGWNDFAGDFATVENAKEMLLVLKSLDSEWWHIVDTETKTIVVSWSDYNDNSTQSKI